MTTFTKWALVAKVWVGGGMFHGCFTYPKLMMIFEGIYFGL
jgi:hypothetical protein